MFGEGRYTSTTPCPRGHVGLRFTRSYACYVCDQERKANSVARGANAQRAKAGYRNSVHHRARTMLQNARARAKARHQPCTLTRVRIFSALKHGVCERTGIAFKVGKDESRRQHPRAPSIDKLDRTKPYSDDNVQIVIWQYNVAKWQLTDLELLEFCRKVVQAAEARI